MNTIIRPHHCQMLNTFNAEDTIHSTPLDEGASRNTARIYWSPLHTFQRDAVGMLRRTVWDRENIVSSTWWIAEPLVLAPWKVDPREISHFLCKSAVSLWLVLVASLWAPPRAWSLLSMIRARLVLYSVSSDLMQCEYLCITIYITSTLNRKWVVKCGDFYPTEHFWQIDFQWWIIDEMALQLQYVHKYSQGDLRQRIEYIYIHPVLICCR